MREDIAGPQGASSRPMWEMLEGMVREKAQEFIQQIMEEEVTELLGREKSERRSTVDSAEGYRNGYGKPRRLAMSSGTITLRRPRVRGVEERFESRVLPLFARRTKELGALLPEPYLHTEKVRRAVHALIAQGVAVEENPPGITAGPDPGRAPDAQPRPGRTLRHRGAPAALRLQSDRRTFVRAGSESARRLSYGSSFVGTEVRGP